ncbi:MAG: hypothetical protein AAF688_07595 [Bacteroidota bacterium]
MQQEKDYLLREVQRLSFVLSQLILKAIGKKSNGLDQDFESIEQTLRTEFDFDLTELAKMDKMQFNTLMSSLNESHLEKLAELIYHVVENSNQLLRHELLEKGLLILEFLEENSQLFSIKRMQLKNKLNDLF